MPLCSSPSAMNHGLPQLLQAVGITSLSFSLRMVFALQSLQTNSTAVMSLSSIVVVVSTVIIKMTYHKFCKRQNYTIDG